MITMNIILFLIIVLLAIGLTVPQVIKIKFFYDIALWTLIVIYGMFLFGIIK